MTWIKVAPVSILSWLLLSLFVLYSKFKAKFYKMQDFNLILQDPFVILKFIIAFFIPLQYSIFLVEGWIVNTLAIIVANTYIMK